MQSNVNTTFIPKRPLTDDPVPKKKGPIGVLRIIGIIAIVLALLSVAGVYIYEAYLNQKIAEQKTSIDRIQDDFEPEVLTLLEELDVRLDAAGQLLDQHVVLSPFFIHLEELTLKSIRYVNFIYNVNERDHVRMTGQAKDYRSIANQSNLFGNSPIIRKHIFSNFVLLPTGQVSFDLAIELNADAISFENSVETFTDQVTAVPTITPTPTPDFPPQSSNFPEDTVILGSPESRGSIINVDGVTSSGTPADTSENTNPSFGL